MTALIGTAPNQVPTNGMLGKLAFQDSVGIQANPGAAPTLASAATLQPQAPISFVSGTTNVVNLTVPPEMVGGGSVVLIPTGLWSTTTAGNIALATAAVVGKALKMVYDAGTAKWYPSY